MNLEKQVLKVLPDFFDYYLELDIKEYETKDDFIIYTLEHEIDMYSNCLRYGFKKEEKEKVSFINKSNINAIKRILNAYYKSWKEV